VGVIAVLAYLAAIVTANLTVAAFGPGVSVLNAFLFIGFDLSLRDHLHEKWRGDWRRMGALVLAGSALAFLINPASGRIALASALAFGAAGLVDWFVYQRMAGRPRIQKMNGSNVASALVDSVVFPTVAFGAFLPLIVAGQWIAKVFGGAVWAWILTRRVRVVARP
jgi:queuosine precursor transporter